MSDRKEGKLRRDLPREQSYLTNAWLSQLHTSGQETLLLQDKSNGYEQVAGRFMSARNPRTGVAIIREWSRTVAPRSAILDLGCGHGVPISQTLIEEGFTVFGVDASRTLIAAFRMRFPNVFR